MLAIVTIKDRIALLPYFLRYYQSVGCSRFIVALYQGTENPLYPAIEEFRSVADLEIRTSVCCPPDQWCGQVEAEAVERIRQTLPDQWHVIADLDEFYWMPEGRKLQEVAQNAQEEGYGAVTTFLADRIAQDGSLTPPGESLCETYPLACNLTESVGGCRHKILLARMSVPLWSGHHFVADKTPVKHYGECQHFKWQPGVLDFLMARYEAYTRLKLPWAIEGPKTVEKFVNGKLNMADPSIRTWPAVRLGI